MSTTPRAFRIRRIGLCVADLARVCDFYERSLGFRRTGWETRKGPGFDALTGLEDARADVAILQLGGQTIELAAFSPEGRAYPRARAANDPWFQHFAVVTADMGAAHAGLGEHAPPISHGGPQALPPSSGNVTAYKFRDPEGHPLELSWFPPGFAPPAWRDPPAGPLFMGVDHSALAVADPDLSAAFYVEQLGLAFAARQVNSGPTQARLDGLDGAEVDIVSLAFAGGGPHVELLGYRQPRPSAQADDPRPNDRAATRLLLDVEHLPALVARLKAARTRFVSPGLVTLEGGSQAALIRDPDGHLLELHEAGR